MSDTAVNFKQLRAFHAVAEQGGFTQAAEALGVTQPAVTVQVRALEKQRGVVLFERGGAGIRATEAGEALHAVTRRLFQTLADCDAVLEAAANLKFGSLTVGLDSPFRAMAMVARFASEHPEVRVQTRMGNASATLTRLLEGDSDVAVFTLVPEAREQASTLHLVELDRQRIRLLVPRGHVLDTGQPVVAERLADQALVLREPGSATRAIVDQVLRRVGPRANVAFEFGSREAVREAVAAGLGISVMIEGEEGSDPRLTAIELEVEPSAAMLVIGCQAERRDHPAVRAFLEIAER